MRNSTISLALVFAGAATIPVSSATAASGYRVTVTCAVPKAQPERQLASNSCLNYVPDGTQTYVAKVRDANGRAVSGVWVSWTDSDAKDAHFRLAQNPCKTGSDGTCQAEVKDTRPRPGEKITITATAGGASATGYLTFT
jgi:hypothetical protein